MILGTPIGPVGDPPGVGDPSGVAALAAACRTRLTTATAGYTTKLLDAAVTIYEHVAAANARATAGMIDDGGLGATLRAKIEALQTLALLTSGAPRRLVRYVLSDSQIQRVCAEVAQALYEGPEWGADVAPLQTLLDEGDRDRATVSAVMIAGGVLLAGVGVALWALSRRV